MSNVCCVVQSSGDQHVVLSPIILMPVLLLCTIVNVNQNVLIKEYCFSFIEYHLLQ